MSWCEVKKEQSGWWDSKTSGRLWRFALSTCREQCTFPSCGGLGKKEGGYFVQELQRCVQGSKVLEDSWNKHHQLMCFSKKAKTVDNQGNQLPLTGNNNKGGHDISCTTIPRCAQMGLWCDKVYINNIKTISFCDPQPFKTCWCKLITTTCISIPLWLFLTQIGSEIYFGLCHLSFPHICISLFLIRAWSI